ncbi:MAG: penicillin-binding protein [Bacteroidota bacterium]|jgi:cell division protein FtsI (penicillin-binding protein 3)
MTQDIRKGILTRVYLVYIGILLFGLAVLGRAFYIQNFEKKQLLEMAKKQEMKVFPIDAIRGNILSDDGTLLAVSIPIFELRMDLYADSLTDEVFKNGVDSLAICLSTMSKDQSPIQIKDRLWEARRNQDRYFLIKRDVTYPELKKIRTFPIFKRGKYKGGLIVIPQWDRDLPYKSLAKRIIGYEKGEGANKVYVGLEGKFTKDLEGVGGSRLMRRTGGSNWMPVDIESQVEPQNGLDIVTTIDIELQDMAEAALRKELVADSADHGCLVVMEVKTGYVKAMVNLGRTKKGTYEEVFNYAIAEANEPGSTFKLASFLVALDDGKIELNTPIQVGNGIVYFAGHKIQDSHPPTASVYTAQQVFEKSSNAGTAKMIYANYANDPQKYIDGLYRLGLNKLLNLQIDGERAPYIKNTKSKYWSDLSLPWIAYGYEVALAPIHLITLYNAIANKGKMVKPLFVKEILKNGVAVKTFKPVVLNPQIVSPATVEKAFTLMEGVVLRGTGTVIASPIYRIAGKTGTAQLAQNNRGYNQGTKNVRYKGSFCGFFPVEDPRFTMMVVIVDPKKGKYYGGAVAAPVFRQISDRLYARQEDIKFPFRKDSINSPVPFAHTGRQADLNEAYTVLGYSTSKVDVRASWTQVVQDGGRIVLFPSKVSRNLMPDVSGMGLKDAMYILEQMGMNVVVNGRGSVVSQSVKPGTFVSKGMPVVLELQGPGIKPKSQT